MAGFFNSDPFKTADPKPPRKMPGMKRDDFERKQAQWDDRGVMRGLLQALSSFSLRKILGADGKAMQVLALELGEEDVASGSPLTITQGTAANKFLIVPGTVNGEMPTASGTALNADPAPEATIAVRTWFWLKCVGTFASPDTYVITIETATTTGVPAGTDITATGFTSYYPIGDVDVVSDVYTITNEHSGGNLGVDSWGLYNMWWKV